MVAVRFGLTELVLKIATPAIEWMQRLPVRSQLLIGARVLLINAPDVKAQINRQPLRMQTVADPGTLEGIELRLLRRPIGLAERAPPTLSPDPKDEGRHIGCEDLLFLQECELQDYLHNPAQVLVG